MEMRLIFKRTKVQEKSESLCTKSDRFGIEERGQKWPTFFQGDPLAFQHQTLSLAVPDYITYLFIQIHIQTHKFEKGSKKE